MACHKKEKWSIVFSFAENINISLGCIFLFCHCLAMGNSLCCQLFTDEFSSARYASPFILDHDKLELYGTWSKLGDVGLLSFRVAAVLADIGILLWFVLIASQGDWSTYTWTSMFMWNLLLNIVYFVFGIALSSRAVATGDTDYSSKVKITTRTFYILRSMVSAGAMFGVIMMIWSLSDNNPVLFTGTNAFVIVSNVTILLLTKLDIFLSNVPIRILHMGYPIIFVSVWIAFTLIIWTSGSENTSTQMDIFEQIRWETEPKFTGLSIMVAFFVAALSPFWAWMVWFVGVACGRRTRTQEQIDLIRQRVKKEMDIELDQDKLEEGEFDSERSSESDSESEENNDAEDVPILGEPFVISKDEQLKTVYPSIK